MVCIIEDAAFALLLIICCIFCVCLIFVASIISDGVSELLVVSRPSSAIIHIVSTKSIDARRMHRIVDECHLCCEYLRRVRAGDDRTGILALSYFNRLTLCCCCCFCCCSDQSHNSHVCKSGRPRPTDHRPASSAL